MPWSADKLKKAEIDVLAFATEYRVAFDVLKEKISAGVPEGEILSAYIAVTEVLRQWRAYSETIQDAVIDSTHIEGLHRKLAELADQKEILARLESEAGTRVDQASSVNPKVTPSPYTNILGLQRTFRSGTRSGLMITGIVFAVLAVAALVFLGVRLAMVGLEPSFQQGGGGRVAGKVSRSGD